MLYVHNGCIYQGKDGKHYVWASEKAITEVSPADLGLVEVTIGATDGIVTEVRGGLREGWTVLVGGF